MEQVRKLRKGGQGVKPEKDSSEEASSMELKSREAIRVERNRLAKDSARDDSGSRDDSISKEDPALGDNDRIRLIQSRPITPSSSYEATTSSKTTALSSTTTTSSPSSCALLPSTSPATKSVSRLQKRMTRKVRRFSPLIAADDQRVQPNPNQFFSALAAAANATSSQKPQCHLNPSPAVTVVGSQASSPADARLQHTFNQSASVTEDAAVASGASAGTHYPSYPLPPLPPPHDFRLPVTSHNRSASTRRTEATQNQTHGETAGRPFPSPLRSVTSTLGQPTPSTDERLPSSRRKDDPASGRSDSTLLLVPSVGRSDSAAALAMETTIANDTLSFKSWLRQKIVFPRKNCGRVTPETHCQPEVFEEGDMTRAERDGKGETLVMEGNPERNFLGEDDVARRETAEATRSVAIVRGNYHQIDDRIIDQNFRRVHCLFNNRVDNKVFPSSSSSSRVISRVNNGDIRGVSNVVNNVDFLAVNSVVDVKRLDTGSDERAFDLKNVGREICRGSAGHRAINNRNSNNKNPADLTSKLNANELTSNGNENNLKKRQRQRRSREGASTIFHLESVYHKKGDSAMDWGSHYTSASSSDYFEEDEIEENDEDEDKNGTFILAWDKDGKEVWVPKGMLEELGPTATIKTKHIPEDEDGKKCGCLNAANRGCRGYTMFALQVIVNLVGVAGICGLLFTDLKLAGLIPGYNATRA